MTETPSKRLVIDADVARSSGSESAEDPTARNCRDFLITVLSEGHRLVITDKISEEWKKHASRFARRWRVSMESQKQVESITPAEAEDLRKELVETARSRNQVEAINKDFHLLQAALATDQTIVSRDERIHRLFKNAARQVSEIRDILWANPATEGESACDWLRAGAPPEASRRLYSAG